MGGGTRLKQTWGGEGGYKHEEVWELNLGMKALREVTSNVLKALALLGYCFCSCYCYLLLAVAIAVATANK